MNRSSADSWLSRRDCRLCYDEMHQLLHAYLRKKRSPYFEARLETREMRTISQPTPRMAARRILEGPQKRVSIDGREQLRGAGGRGLRKQRVSLTLSRLSEAVRNRCSAWCISTHTDQEKLAHTDIYAALLLKLHERRNHGRSHTSVHI